MRPRQEQLRQEREAFDLAKNQSERWFNLRLRMGYVTLWAIPCLIAALVALIIFAPYLPQALLPWALVTVEGGAISALLAGWRQILNGATNTTVAPLTKPEAWAPPRQTRAAKR